MKDNKICAVCDNFFTVICCDSIELIGTIQIVTSFKYCIICLIQSTITRLVRVEPHVNVRHCKIMQF